MLNGNATDRLILRVLYLKGPCTSHDMGFTAMHPLYSFGILSMVICMSLALPLPLQHGAVVDTNKRIAFISKVSIRSVLHIHPKKLTRVVGGPALSRCVGFLCEP